MFIRGGKYRGFYLVLLLTIVMILFQIACNRKPRHLSICEIQGAGSLSPYLGSTVLVEGIISADFGDQNPPGFYLDGKCPENENSRGIWIVLDDEVDWIDLGDEIRLEGVVEERNLETMINARVDSIEILSFSNPISDPINLADIYNLDPLSFSYEDWEGELVYLPGSTVLIHRDEKDDLLVCPIFVERFFPEYICNLGQSYYLSLRVSLKHPGLRSAAVGDQVLFIMGVLKQEQKGYFIQILDPSAIRLKLQKVSPSNLMAVNFDQESEGTPFDISSNTPQLSTQSPAKTVMPISTATRVPSPTYYPVHLLLTEIHPNPEGEEPELEWVEIYNPESYGILLTGVKLGDEESPEGREGILQFPDGYYIEAGEVLVIANDGLAFLAQYGFSPDFEMYASDNRVPEMLPYSGWGGNKIQFNNSGDELLLIDPWDQVIDQLAYGKSTWGGFTPSIDAPREGHSLERYPPERDRDIAGDWRESKGGSPGWLDRSPPTSAASLTFSPSPSLTPTPSPSLTTTPSPSLDPSNTPSVTIQSTQSPTGEVAPSWTLAGTLPFTNPPSETSSHFITPSLTASLAASAIPSLMPTPLASPSPTLPSVFPSATVNLTASITITVSAMPSQVLSETPTIKPERTVTISPSRTITSAPTLIPTLDNNLAQIVINEIHADPHPLLGDANNDGEVHSDNDEFLELVNVGEESLDLGGWQIKDLIKSRFVFPEGTILNGGCGLVIFGGEVSVSLIEGSQVFSTGSLALNNNGDTIFLLDQEQLIQITLSYGPEGGEDQSLTLFPDLVGQLPHNLHSEIIEAEGRLFSPGTRVDGNAFGNCP